MQSQTGEQLLAREVIGWLVPDDDDMIDLAKKGGYFWDKVKAAFISIRSGKEATVAQVQAHLDRYGVRFTQRNLDTVTRDLIKGKVPLAVWQQKAAAEIKNAWMVNLVVGKGGVNNLTLSDYGRAGNRLRGVYGHLNRFALDIASGKLSQAQILARIKLYSNNTMTAYYDGLTAAKQAVGYDQERRILQPAEHCADCVGYAEQGWVPIGTLPEPGIGSVCNGNCRCLKEYRRSATAVAAAV